MKVRLVIGALLLALTATAWAQCSLDLEQGVLTNGFVTLRLPKVGGACDFALERDGTVVAPRQWYYVVTGDLQSGRATYRSTGPVQSVEALEVTPERASVRVVALTDDPDAPDRATFTLDYSVTAGVPAVRHEMTLTPTEPLGIRSYEYFVATQQAGAGTHRLYSLADGALASTPAQTNEAYGRISFPTDPAFVALADTRAPLALAVGVPSADVSAYRYSIEFTRFEISRSAGYVSPAAPLHDFALLAVGADVDELARLFREFVADTDRPERDAEPRLPAPDLRARAPEMTVTRGIDSSSGALTELDAGAGNLLERPGGIVFVEWPDHARIAPDAGRATGLGRTGNSLRWTWEGRGLTVEHEQIAGEPLQWNAQVRNETGEQRLLEVRLELPLTAREGYFFDGMRLLRFDENTPDHQLTTLVPGARLSQGIFPAVCVHDGASGVAIGMPPLQIESFYGARLERTEDGTRVLSYVLRWALPAGEERTARFVLYAIDPRWSWRSMVARYWEAWPEVFAAPEREDVWGLYASAGPGTVQAQGDRFIERCRRLRVGAMELYAPFAKTGDFYPEDEPVYHTDAILTHEQMRAVEETANIAACNISYVIPTKCNREMALAKYDDAIIRNADGSRFMLDQWAVIPDEKLAGMFAWGNSFGDDLIADVHRIVDNYHPDGFYFDNGAFVWEDYGRVTPWMAFDDEGRTYTNGGIPYAMIQDDLAEYAPQVHRNPGEFIQYFSGFRGHSHLTNIVGSQRHYVRSHRLIMGYKPIYPGHPRRIGSRQDLYDYLELGGLPWMAGMNLAKERLTRAWAPIAIDLAKAGWRPVTDAVADSPEVRVERFGDGPVFFTVRNLSHEAVTTTLSLRGEWPDCGLVHKPGEVETEVADGLTRVTLTVPAREMEFIRASTGAEHATAAEAPHPQALGPLRNAPPTSIVLPEQPSPAQERVARRIRGFVLVQADILGHEPSVEIVRGEANATHPDRVVIEPGDGLLTIETRDAHTTVLRFGDEAMSVPLLSRALDEIAVMQSDELEWVP